MYAYCGNNPINYRDDSGEIPFWALVAKTLLDWGLAHRLVQADIKAKHFCVEIEVPVDRNHYRGGRVDVYQNGRIWEVKSTGSADLAAPQARSYLGCKVSDSDSWVKELGPANAFSGNIHLSLLGYNYEIEYNTPQEGVILYSVCEIKPAKQESVEPATAEAPIPVRAPCIPIIIPGGPAPSPCPDPSNGHGLPGNRDPWLARAY